MLAVASASVSSPRARRGFSCHDACVPKHRTPRKSTRCSEAPQLWPATYRRLVPTRFCFACGATNAWSASRCGNCQETLPPTCFRCYADVTPTARRCPRCARSRFRAGDSVTLFCERQASGKGGHLNAQETVHRYAGVAFW
jgi:ribosomal protein L40E